MAFAGFHGQVMPEVPVACSVPLMVIFVVVLAVMGSHAPVFPAPVAKLNRYCPTNASAVQVPDDLVNSVALVLVPVISACCWGALNTFAEEPRPSEFSVNVRRDAPCVFIFDAYAVCTDAQLVVSNEGSVVPAPAVRLR